MSANDIPSFNCFLKSEVDIPSVCSDSMLNSKEINKHARNRKELSLKEKLEILKLYDKLPKMSQRSAAVQLNISQPVLCKILKNRHFIESIMLRNKNSVRKRTRGGKEREIESALKLWYIEVEKKNVPINGQIIREKAKELAKQMGKEFAATDGWFTRWRKRENIVYNTLFRRKSLSEKSSKNFVPDLEVGGRISPVVDGPKNWEGRNESFCEVFIKTEPIYDYHMEEKTNDNPPTDEEMLEALRILSAGVKHRTSDLQPHYDYEHFIYKLLKRIA